MTDKERENALFKLGQHIKAILPDFHGYVQYNLVPERKTVLLTKHETIVEDKP